MYDVLEGVKIVELASWTFVPSAGAVLADWGADVIKVEHPFTGDPQRGLLNAISGGGGMNPFIEVPNRGKRSLGLDVFTSEGREILSELIRDADVFLTNYLPAVRERLRIDVADIWETNERVIYGRGSAHGIFGAEAGRGGFDLASAWARGGLAFLMTSDGGEPPFQPGSVGDLSAGVNLAGAIAAALYRRERTGRPAVVDTSLYSSAMWVSSQSITAAPMGKRLPYVDRRTGFNPLVNYFPTQDGRWICLCMLMENWWPNLAQHLGLEHLIDDERFVTAAARADHRDLLVDILDDQFRTRTLDQWREALFTVDGVWAPVLSPQEIADDPQAIENGFIADVDLGDGGNYQIVASPAQFDERPIGSLRRGPEHGEHTEEILLELGRDWDSIADLKRQSVVN